MQLPQKKVLDPIEKEQRDGASDTSLTPLAAYK